MSATPCPDCGALVPAGRRLCQNCLYPIYLQATEDDDARDDVSADDIELPTGMQPALDPDEFEPETQEQPPVAPRAPRDPADAIPTGSAVPPLARRRRPPTPLVVLITTAVAALAMIAAALVIRATRDADPVERDPFAGRWVSIDNDGSSQEILFTGTGDRRKVRLSDDQSGRCGGPSVESGTGRLIDPRRLTVEVTSRCGDGRRLDPTRLLFVYEVRRGVLIESNGVEWRRPRA